MLFSNVGQPAGPAKLPPQIPTTCRAARGGSLCCAPAKKEEGFAPELELCTYVYVIHEQRVKESARSLCVGIIITPGDCSICLESGLYRVVVFTLLAVCVYK